MDLLDLSIKGILCKGLQPCHGSDTIVSKLTSGHLS